MYRTVQALPSGQRGVWGNAPARWKHWREWGERWGGGGLGGGLGGFVRGIGRRPVGRMEANSLLDLFVSDITGE